MYISKEQAKEIRNNLKKKFKDFKLSVTVRNCSLLVVSVLSSPLNFDFQDDKKYIQVNHYYLDRYPNTDILKQITDLCNFGNWYFHLEVGQWNRPYQMEVTK